MPCTLSASLDDLEQAARNGQVESVLQAMPGVSDLADATLAHSNCSACSPLKASEPSKGVKPFPFVLHVVTRANQPTRLILWEH